MHRTLDQESLEDEDDSNLDIQAALQLSLTDHNGRNEEDEDLFLQAAIQSSLVDRVTASPTTK